MLLKYKTDHISIKEFNSITIEDFTLLTGLNGSGKTHLLEAIHKGHVEIEGYDQTEIIYYNYNDFTILTHGQEKDQQYRRKTDEWNNGKSAYLSRINKLKDQAREQRARERSKIDNIIYHYTQQPEYNFDNLFGHQKDYESLEILKRQPDINVQIISAHQGRFTGTFFNFIINYFQAGGNIADINVDFLRPQFASIASQSENDLKNINEDFHNYVSVSTQNKKLSSITNNDLESPNLFLADIENEEKGYQILKHQNIINQIKATEYGENIEFLTKEEFVAKNGFSPIEQINEVLKEYDCNGYILSPVGKQEYLGMDSSNIRIHIWLNHKDNYFTNFDQLSSGEKTLIALSLLIYKTRKKKIIPRILLLDEIDSALHPSMIIRLLNVIQELFIKTKKLKVIFATHSPTTIALAEEKSIFVVNKDGMDRIEKQSKNQALKILTEGFMTLEEGLRILDQVAQKEITIFTEGNNIDFIKLAIFHFNPELAGKVEIVDTLKDRTGKNQLSVLYEFFLKMPHKNKVLFIYDCDVTSKPVENETTFYYTFEQNTKNKKVLKGIENLFEEVLFKDEFYQIKAKDDGGIHSSLDKSKFLNYVIERNKKSDFTNFEGLINKISFLFSKKTSN